MLDDATRAVIVPTVVSPTATPPPEPIERLAGAFLASYRNLNTRRNYELAIRDWLGFCAQYGIEPLTARRSHFDLFMREREEMGNGPATIFRKMSALTMFYGWLHDEDYVPKNQARLATRPKVPTDSTREWMTGVELARIIEVAQMEGGYTSALICLLGYNALRIGEVVRADVGDLGQVRHNRTLRIVGKGDKPDVIALNGPTTYAIEQALGGRMSGPLIINGANSRLTRDSAARCIRRMAKRAGIRRNITPHSFRHSALTAALDAGATLDEVRQFARHTKVETTLHYLRKSAALDASLAYRLQGYVAERSTFDFDAAQVA